MSAWFLVNLLVVTGLVVFTLRMKVKTFEYRLAGLAIAFLVVALLGLFWFVGEVGDLRQKVREIDNMGLPAREELSRQR